MRNWFNLQGKFILIAITIALIGSYSINNGLESDNVLKTMYFSITLAGILIMDQGSVMKMKIINYLLVGIILVLGSFIVNECVNSLSTIVESTAKVESTNSSSNEQLAEASSNEKDKFTFRNEAKDNKEDKGHVCIMTDEQTGVEYIVLYRINNLGGKEGLAITPRIKN